MQNTLLTTTSMKSGQDVKPITDINDLLALPIAELDAMSESQLKSILDESVFTQARQPLLPEDKPGKQGNVHRLVMDYMGKNKMNAVKLKSDLDALSRQLK